MLLREYLIILRITLHPQVFSVDRIKSLKVVKTGWYIQLLVFCKIKVLISWNRDVPEKPIITWPVREIDAFHGRGGLMYSHESIIGKELNRFNPVSHLYTLFKLAISSYLCLWLPNGLFLSSFPTKSVCLAHFILFCLIFLIILGKKYNL